MFIPILVAPLVLQIAVSDTVPNWDVTASCRGAAEAAGPGEAGQQRLKGCLDSEQNTKQKLQTEWTNFPTADRLNCIRSIQWFEPTYTELAACLEMGRDAKTGDSRLPMKMPKQNTKKKP
jgi:hypothetical protein